jgi:hypothetical protein
MATSTAPAPAPQHEGRWLDDNVICATPRTALFDLYRAMRAHCRRQVKQDACDRVAALFKEELRRFKQGIRRDFAAFADKAPARFVTDAVDVLQYMAGRGFVVAPELLVLAAPAPASAPEPAPAAPVAEPAPAASAPAPAAPVPAPEPVPDFDVEDSDSDANADSDADSGADADGPVGGVKRPLESQDPVRRLLNAAVQAFDVATFRQPSNAHVRQAVGAALGAALGGKGTAAVTTAPVTRVRDALLYAATVCELGNRCQASGARQELKDAVEPLCRRPSRAAVVVDDAVYRELAGMMAAIEQHRKALAGATTRQQHHARLRRR